MKRTPRLCAYAVGMAAVAVLACAALRDGEPERKGCLEVAGRISEELVRPAARQAAVPDRLVTDAAKPAPVNGEARREAGKDKPAEPLKVKALSLARAASAQRADVREPVSIESGVTAPAVPVRRVKPVAAAVPADAPIVIEKPSAEEKPAPAVSATPAKPAPVTVAKTEKNAAPPKPASASAPKKTEKPARVAKARAVSPVEDALADARAGRLAPAASKETPRKNAQYERVVTSAKYAMKGSLIKLVLHGNAPMVGNFYVLTQPDRVVLDLAGNWDVELPKVPSNRLIASARVGQHDDKTRLVFDMKNTGKVALVPLNRNALELRIQ